MLCYAMLCYALLSCFHIMLNLKLMPKPYVAGVHAGQANAGPQAPHWAPLQG